MKFYYQDDYVTLYHGDALEVLPGLKQGFDLLLTDPPYGINRDKGAGGGGFDGFGRKTKRATKRYAGNWDKKRPDAAMFELMVGIAHHAIIWGGNYFSDLLPQSNRWLIWDKLQTMPSFSDCEIAWTNLKGTATKRFIYASNGMLAGEKNRVHPTQKPLAVIKWCITQAPQEVKAIVDPFAGSGTTGVAAKELNKKCVLVEKEEKYCEVAAKRLCQEVFNFGEL